MQLKDIIGQEKTIAHLLSEQECGRIPHAHLLIGQDGYGTLPLALAFAQFLNCTNPTNGDSCGVCPSCRKYARLEHADLHILFPFTKPDSKKEYHCDDFLPAFRKLILEHPYATLQDWFGTMDSTKQGLIYASESDVITRIQNLKTYEGRYKVIVVWGVDKMNEVCANKLLKVLEEPTPSTLFLLTTSNPDGLLPTILSRVQCVSLSPIEQGALVGRLQKDFPNVPEETVRQVARMSLGNYADALSIMGSNDVDRENFELFVSLMRLAYARNYLELRKWSEGFDKNRERAKYFLSYAQRMVRENFVYNLHLPINYLTTDEESFSSRFARFITERNVELIVEDLQNAATEIEQNCSIKIVLFSVALHMCNYLRR